MRLFAAAGLDRIRVEPKSVLFREADEALLLLMLPDAAQRAVRFGLPSDEAEAWLAEVRRRGAEGTFFASATGFLVTGIVA